MGTISAGIPYALLTGHLDDDVATFWLLLFFRGLDNSTRVLGPITTASYNKDPPPKKKY